MTIIWLLGVWKMRMGCREYFNESMTVGVCTELGWCSEVGEDGVLGDWDKGWEGSDSFDKGCF